MRTLLAIAVCLGSILALSQGADADRKHKRSAKPHYYTAQPRYSREEIECEHAWHADPTGQYAGFPCWAREAFGRGSEDDLGNR